MRILRLAPPVLSLALAACAQAQLLTPAGLPIQDVVVNAGAVNGRTAVVSLSAAYSLQAAGTHHWAASDVTEYDVDLQVKNGSGSFVEMSPVMSAQLMVSGGVAPKAVFANLTQGHFYRAFVTAKSGSTPINAHASADYADFDFTATQDVQDTVNDTLTVHLDGVDYSGTDALGFSSPAPGGFANPTATPFITGATPAPSPGTPLGTATVSSPLGMAIDASHNVWVTDIGTNSVTKLSSTGSLIGAFSVGSQPTAVAIDPSGNAWVSNSGSNNVTELSNTGNILGTFSSVGLIPSSVAVGSNGHVWVANSAGPAYLAELSSTGSLMATFTTPAVSVAIDASNNVWVAGNSGMAVTKLSSTGSLLAAVSTPNRAMSVAVDNASNHVWVGIASISTVLELDGTTAAVLGSFSVPVEATYLPDYIAVGTNGTVWVPNSGGHLVTELSSTGSILATFSLSGAAGVATDTANGYVWLADNAAGRIVQLAN